MTPPRIRWWRLAFSPTETARLCRLRPALARRLGLTAAALWVGEFVAWLVVIAYNEPFGEPLWGILLYYVLLLAGLVALLVGWVWALPPSHWLGDRPYRRAVIAPATIPAWLITLPDSAGSVYRDARYFSAFGQGPTFYWQPNRFEQYLIYLTNTNAWLLAGLMVWLLMALLASRRVRELPYPDDGTHCPSCGYNLHGTRLAGIDRCPECGEAVPEAVPDASPTSGSASA